MTPSNPVRRTLYVRGRATGWPYRWPYFLALVCRATRASMQAPPRQHQCGIDAWATLGQWGYRVGPVAASPPPRGWPHRQPATLAS
jgi:hypothetical protein